MLAAMRRASSRLSSLAAPHGVFPRSILEIDVGERPITLYLLPPQVQ
jgi:hypothetical protein